MNALLYWLITSFLVPGPADSGVIQLTNNYVDEEDLVIGDEYVAWLSEGSLISYDLIRESFLEISPGVVKNSSPALDGETLVWIYETGNEVDIRIFDLFYRFEYQLKTEGVKDSDPQIKGNHLAWRGQLGDKSYLFMHDIENGITSRIKITYPEYSFHLGDQYLVWSDNGPENTEIFFLDLATGIKHQLTNNDSKDDKPHVDATKIIWQKQVQDKGHELYMYDCMANTNSIVSDLANLNQPSILVDNIAWNDGEGRLSEVFLYNISDQTKLQITKNNYPEESLLLGKDHLVWINRSTSFPRLVLYDINAKTTLQPPNLVMTDAEIHLYNGLVAWTAFDGHDYEVFLYYLPSLRK